MFTKSKIGLCVAVMLGAASVAHAEGATKDYGGVIVRPSPNVDSNAPAASSKHASGSYAQGHVNVRRSPNVDPNASGESSGPARPESPFEKTWMDFQSHDDQ
jgi:hypothetical protein